MQQVLEIGYYRAVLDFGNRSNVKGTRAKFAPFSPDLYIAIGRLIDVIMTIEICGKSYVSCY